MIGDGVLRWWRMRIQRAWRRHQSAAVTLTSLRRGKRFEVAVARMSMPAEFVDYPDAIARNWRGPGGSRVDQALEAEVGRELG